LYAFVVTEKFYLGNTISFEIIRWPPPRFENTSVPSVFLIDQTKQNVWWSILVTPLFFECGAACSSFAFFELDRILFVNILIIVYGNRVVQPLFGFRVVCPIVNAFSRTSHVGLALFSYGFQSEWNVFGTYSFEFNTELRGRRNALKRTSPRQTTHVVCSLSPINVGNLTPVRCVLFETTLYLVYYGAALVAFINYTPIVCTKSVVDGECICQTYLLPPSYTSRVTGRRAHLQLPRLLLVIAAGRSLCARRTVYF